MKQEGLILPPTGYILMKDIKEESIQRKERRKQ
jgi:hypothetical protein